MERSQSVSFRLQSVVVEPRGAGVEIALLGEAEGLRGGGAVGVARGGAIAGHLEQVGADGVELVTVGEARVGCEGGDELEAGARAADHRDRDGVVQRDDGIVGTAAIAAWS